MMDVCRGAKHGIPQLESERERRAQGPMVSFQGVFLPSLGNPRTKAQAYEPLGGGGFKL